MDIYCTVCGEPWGVDELHDVPGVPYAKAARRFRKVGCAVFDTPHSPSDDDRATLSAIAFDLMGDDIDGISSFMKDFS